MSWSKKYKSSIDCDNPKGFSQRAHCQGRKKRLREFRDTIKEHVRYTKLNLPKETVVETVAPKETLVTLVEKIKRHGDSYVVTDSSGKKVLGKHKTKRAAVRQIAAIEASKAGKVEEGKIADIGKGLAKGAGVGALAVGMGLATKPEPSVAPPPTPNTGEVGQLEDKPQERPTLVTPKKVVNNNKEKQATLDDHSDHLHSAEGFRSRVYDDHKGNPTVGFGHMFKSGSKSTWESAGIGHLHDDVKAGKAKLSQADARKLLHHELETIYIPRARKHVERYDDLNKDAQVAVVGSVFRGGLTGSPKTLKHLNAGKFGDAADEFLDNAEYRQSKRDGTGVHKRMEGYSDAYRNARYVR